jgi:KaiC/GvpD/RAD55 family RecA-like ATPase
MIVHIASGIRGLDDLISKDDSLGMGGIPENTATLIYGPPKVGKSLFCYKFAFQGLSLFEPCLYLTTELAVPELIGCMTDTIPESETFDENELFYVVDVALKKSEEEIEKSELYQFSSIQNPTDILVKVTMGLHSISKNNPRFRAVIDSLTNIMKYNDEMLVIRVLKTYLMRVKEAGGTAIITYTEGSSSLKTETYLKSMVDNIIHLDGEYLTIEAMKGLGMDKTTYQITKDSINLTK